LEKTAIRAQYRRLVTSGAEMDAIQLTNVVKTFGETRAVNDVSLAVPQGAVYGFIGPNGSGKTTTMRMIVNIIYPDSGIIRVFGEEPRGGTGRIGYLPEERGLYRRMNVRPLLEFHGELRGGRNVAAQVRSWLDRLELGHCAERRVDTLSKGMSQKVQFIASVIPEPKLLILDEPFTGLDPVSANSIRSAILDLRRRGATVILSTHDMNVAESMCDYIFMIYRGRKVLDGTLESIQQQYGNDTIQVTADGGASVMNGLPNVEKIRDLGQVQELRMALGCDTQAVLRTLVERTRVTTFSVAKPSLEDIFVRIAGPEAAEKQHA
jgi:ABC-2 type transport system ATP-binding protein